MQLQTTDLESTFRALRAKDPAKLSKSEVPFHKDYKSIPKQNYAPTSSAHTQWGNGMAKFASAASAGTCASVLAGTCASTVWAHT